VTAALGSTATVTTEDPPTTPDAPDALRRLVDRVLARTGLTPQLVQATPLPTLVAIEILLDEVDALRKERGQGRTPVPKP
jgi:hypothetical protein